MVVSSEWKGAIDLEVNDLDGGNVDRGDGVRRDRGDLDRGH